MGTPQAAAISLERIVTDGHDVVAVYTQPDRPAGRGNKIAFSPVKQYALDKGFDVVQPAKIRTPEALSEFRSYAADVAVVVAYGRILPGTFLKAFPNGAINLHFSLLPKFRGAAPVNWAIVHGETVTGVTTIQMDEGLDTGPILMQRETGIGQNETAIELMDRLSGLGADLLCDTLSKYGTLSARKQTEAEATFAPLMRKDDGMISWMLTASEISNRVRGFQPFPTSFTYFREKKLTIWSSSLTNIEHPIAQPGEILEAGNDRLLVFCGGDSVLQIDEVQIEGKRRMNARDFINGFKPSVGEKLGR